MPGAASADRAMISARSARMSGSPPVKRTSRMPSSRTGEADQPADLDGGQQVVAGDRRETLLGHAVGAAQRALLGDRDAQVAGDAAEAVDELGGVGAALDGCGDRLPAQRIDARARHPEGDRGHGFTLDEHA